MIFFFSLEYFYYGEISDVIEFNDDRIGRKNLL